MRWSQIKTLFIISFLILNIYLLMQFLGKQDQADLSTLEYQESTIEEQLAGENIEIPDLDDDDIKEPFISVRQKVFTSSDMKKFDSFEDQEAELISNNFIVSLFDKPIKISSNASNEQIEEVMEKRFIYPDEYEFWNWNKEKNILVFFQKKLNRPIYYNRNGMIAVFLNDKNEIMFYTQTMLGEEEARQDKKTLSKPITAIETLYNSQKLDPGDTVSKVDIGLHTRVPLENGVQVFVPTWKVTVNDEQNYFVNAIEGFVFSGEEQEFIEETIQHDVERIEESQLKKKTKKKILDLFEDKVEDTTN